jgi:hypothetical protein
VVNRQNFFFVECTHVKSKFFNQSMSVGEPI